MTKYKTVKKLQEIYSSAIITEAQKNIIKTDGRKSQSQLFDMIINEQCSPLLEKIQLDEPILMTEEEALMLIIQSDMSINTYKILRQNGIEHNVKIYPPYKKVRNVFIFNFYKFSIKIIKIVLYSYFNILFCKLKKKILLIFVIFT